MRSQSEINAGHTRRRMKLLDRAVQALWEDRESRDLCLAIRKGDWSQQQSARKRLAERAAELGIDYLRPSEYSHVVGHVVSCSFNDRDCGR